MAIPSRCMACSGGVGCCQAAPVPNEPGAAKASAPILGIGDVEAKLASHDEFAKAAIRYLIDWLRDEPEPLLAMARGRHAEGHYRYKDSLMFEYGQDELVAEAAQELADAVCYLALMLRRAAHVK